MQNPAANEPDYKALLEKYMRHIIRMDGESYCPESCDTDFAAGELEYLRSLSDALLAKKEDQTSQAYAVINSWSRKAMEVPAKGSATTIIRDSSGSASAFSHTSFTGGGGGGSSCRPSHDVGGMGAEAYRRERDPGSAGKMVKLGDVDLYSITPK